MSGAELRPTPRDVARVLEDAAARLERGASWARALRDARIAHELALGDGVFAPAWLLAALDDAARHALGVDLETVGALPADGRPRALRRVAAALV